jgi:hypothetical protein
MRKTLLLSIVALLAAPFGVAAEIVVTPLRQVIDETRKDARYEIVNPSNRIIVARVRWTDLSAVPSGYESAKPEARTALSAAPYLVVSPSTIRLEPGARAEIRVRLKNGVALPQGERRSHLLIETEAARTPIRKAGGGLEVDIGVGLSTPVMVRGGAVAAPRLSFGATRLVRMDDGQLALETSLSRTGAYSAFGRLEAEIAEAGAPPRKIGSLANVAVYHDARERIVKLPLGAAVLPAGTLSVRYIGAAEYEGRVFATKTFEIEAAN